jgi:hypothetical protein
MKNQALASILIILVALAAESVYAQQSDGRPDISRAEFILSRIDEAVANEFEKAWRSAGSGADSIEAVVLLYKKIDGSLMARSPHLTYQSKQFGFKWVPNIIGVVHTHPNTANPRPQGEDKHVADRFGIPVYTITSRGMYMYDPATKRTSLVQDGLDWMKTSKWDQNSRFASNRQSQPHLAAKQ